MAEHLSAERLEAYGRGSLPPAEMLRADDHLGGCARCRALAAEAAWPAGVALESLHARLLSEAAVAETEHLAYEQMEALADGRLGEADREIVGGHLGLCRSCTEEFEDLVALRESLGGAAHAAATPAARKASLAERLVAPLRALRAALTPPRFAAAAALTLAFISLSAFLLFRQPRRAPDVARTADAPRPEGASGADRSVEPAPYPRGADAEATPAPRGSETEPARPPVLTSLADGRGRVTLDAEGNVEGLPALPAAARLAVTNALASGRLEAPDLSELRGSRGTLMGGGGGADSFSLLTPVGMVVRTARPRLSWRPLAGASHYVVMVFDDGQNTVAVSPPLSEPAWPLPRALARGRVYTWQVTAHGDGGETIAPEPPEPEARFKVLEAAQEEALRSAENSRERSHLALGVLYARAGLLDEAEREFALLARANPGSATPRKLLNDVRTARSRSKK